ncbi:hypothetical protein EROM_030900 [Encephalitozoon romaleae SJ-2008]|uniref:Uncharacterized protein n=1 Tax=Encephalitozoon romaleae (strain SJ-2008) TaxID=1178016 RepID=I6ZSZ0_ENCRO|nr:hypothetical protein EROM_030900 [Encephalitozoon romaleae SJ-2008]AFN82711.1 hypothetical protein EROM_030900 [Encephalitozoon romaleae SJ-2008]
MDWYLKKYPDAKTLAAKLSKLALSDGVDVSEYLDPENLELADHIYTGRLYRSRDVRKVLRRIAGKESSRVERIMYEMFCKRKIVFDNYLLKLSFVRRFGRFKRFFVDGKEVEYKMQMMVHRQLYLGEDVTKEIEKEIMKIPGEKVWVYVGFLGGSLSRDVIMRIMDCVDIEVKPFVGSFLSMEDYYNKMCYAVLKSPFSEKERIVSSMGTLDKAQFYKAMLHVWFSEGAEKRKFIDFVELMRLVKVGRSMKMEIINGYLNGLVYHRMLEEFVKLFEYVRRAGVDEDKVFGRLYSAIRKYKKGGRLELSGFLDRCKEGRRKGLFSPYSWEDIYDVYKE